MPPVRSHAEVSNHLQEVLQLLENRESRKLTAYLQLLHPAEVVALLNQSDPEIRPHILKYITGLDHLSEVITRANTSLRATAFALIDDSRVAAVVRRQEIDDAADLVGALPRRRQLKILRHLSPQQAKDLTYLLEFNQDSAGRIMTTRYLSFPPEILVEDAVQQLRRRLQQHALHEDTDLGYAYLLDGDQRLTGVCSLRELLSADPTRSIREIANTEVISVAPEDDQERVARLIADYDLSAIPVCATAGGKMLGIITVDDVLDIVEEELTEDLLKLAGTEEDDTVGATTLVAIRSRIPWLAVSWAGGILGATLLGAFSSTLERAVALAFFMPVVFGMGGNVGSQSSTITVRGLATGELAKNLAFKRMRKEAKVGLLLGMLFAVLLGIVSYALYGDPRLSAVVSSSILVSMVCAASLGSIVPVLFDRLGLDPAVASGPLVTTATDVLSITIYFSIAALLL